ncbi:RNA pyrophosphohydrolase [Roseivivax sp. GX 12232]|uniref:RNA pyrophosphohydrolase n=1 Tax=Roseivivax sp. GX 12232 TaxID=2900547 RepID=UPI001E4ADEEA|nr:RNA pyrophosphohydrolase [Roseivivax sp. GX 12232]MCE0506093.1 RNA pyrophosphohydrolase [Roseivivax sp. GX 12232]
MTPAEIDALPYRPCVGVMLANAKGEVFVGQRIDSELPAWQMPQGGIDPGEAPREAALRELLEETGIPAERVRVEAETADWVTYDLPHEIVPRIWKGRFKGQKQKWFLLRFLGSDDEVTIETDHPEFSSWRWLPVAELPGQIVPFKRAVYEAVVAELGPKL